jgi:hypothetical protein
VVKLDLEPIMEEQGLTQHPILLMKNLVKKERKVGDEALPLQI